MTAESRFRMSSSNDSYESVISDRFISVNWGAIWAVRLRRTALFACGERSPHAVFAHPGNDPPATEKHCRLSQKRNGRFTGAVAVVLPAGRDFATIRRVATA